MILDGATEYIKQLIEREKRLKDECDVDLKATHTADLFQNHYNTSSLYGCVGLLVVKRAATPFTTLFIRPQIPGLLDGSDS